MIGPSGVGIRSDPPAGPSPSEPSERAEWSGFRPPAVTPDPNEWAAGGTYTLLIELPTATTIGVGALGEHRFRAGWYAYTGSALGSGGFARVDRHRELAAGERTTRHWHIDYVLGRPDATLRDVVTSAGADVECAVAASLPAGPVDGFGASDCGCRAHLARLAGRDAALSAVRRAHDEAGG